MALERNKRAFHQQLSPALLFAPERNQRPVTSVLLAAFASEEVKEGISLCAWPVMVLQLGRSWNTSGSKPETVAMLRAQVQPEDPSMHSQQQNKQAQRVWVSWEAPRSWLANRLHLSHGFGFEHFLGGCLRISYICNIAHRKYSVSNV